MELSSSLQHLTGLSLMTQTILVMTVTFIVVRMMTKKRYHLPPGPTSLPLLGNALSFVTTGFGENISKWRKKYGPIFSFYFGTTRMVIINDINTLNEAFVKGGSAASGRPFLHSLHHASEGNRDILMASYSDIWKFQRKVASQAIRQYITGSQLEQRVHEVIQPIIASMLNQSQPFNPRRHISLAIFNVINGICFGTVLDMDDSEFIKLVDSFDLANKLGGRGFLEDFFPPLRMWPTKNFQDFLTLFDELNAIFRRNMEQHIENFDPNDIRDLTDNIILAKQQAEADPSSTMHTQFTESHAVQTLADVFGGGVDTSRTQLGWIFLVVAARKDIQRKMHEEIDRVIGDNIPSKEHRTKLVYVEAVMLESLRLYPVAPLGLPHETMQDMVVAGYEIPKNTTMLANQIEILHDPANWEEPLEFKPERFLDESGTKLAPRRQCWIPFSLGHRACLGEAMAKLQMIYTIAGLMQKLTFDLPDDVTADLSCNQEGFTNSPKAYELIVKSR